ncbi:hypothetical protein chiPu_0016989 [Chiloscyllium punctatum]|uniref:Uncharacterized protein n=1 Tax=Chiloscyllium punctatum TaxID=137246 RepID=A0A401T768_CHIPU|nr:hypothetical protein [Chiloscyllium punctatum]
MYRNRPLGPTGVCQFTTPSPHAQYHLIHQGTDHVLRQKSVFVSAFLREHLPTGENKREAAETRTWDCETEINERRFNKGTGK